MFIGLGHIMVHFLSLSGVYVNNGNSHPFSITLTTTVNCEHAGCVTYFLLSPDFKDD